MACHYSILNQEILWREEVLYLHNLWKQGPTGASHSRPIINPSSTLHHLGRRSSFKPRKYRNRLRRTKKAVVSEKEWPCELDPEPTSSHVITGWPQPPSKPVPLAPTAEEIAKASAFYAQKNCVETCKFFFFKKDSDGNLKEGDDGTEVEETDDEGTEVQEEDEYEDDDEEEEEEEEVEERAFNFFIDVFTKNHDLRKFYEVNSEKGEFLCLVCEASRVKKKKMYGDCVGLVQHCSSLAKAGRRGAHRGLAKAICRVVGWNFSRLPMFVLDTEETLGQALASDACQKQEELKKDKQIQNEAG